jgi:hypothetical protein
MVTVRLCRAEPGPGADGLQRPAAAEDWRSVSNTTGISS